MSYNYAINSVVTKNLSKPLKTVSKTVTDGLQKNTSDVFEKQCTNEIKDKKAEVLHNWINSLNEACNSIPDFFVQGVRPKTSDLKNEQIREIESIQTPYSPINIINSWDVKYNDIDSFCECIEQKIRNNMGVLSVKDIEKMANEISKNVEMPLNEVLDVMYRLTQFGNYKSLKRLGKIFNKMEIGDLEKSEKISLNNVVRYIGGYKEQMSLDLYKHDKNAIMLDDYFLKELELYSEINRKRFNKIKRSIERGNTVLINLRGTGFKVGEKYLSYTFADGGQNLEKLTESVLMEVKKGKPLDEVLNGDYENRAEAIFGKEIRDKIKNIRFKNLNPTTEDIAKNICPNIITADDIKRVILTILKHEMENNVNLDVDLALRVLEKYYNNYLELYSNDMLAKLAKDKHKQIASLLKSMGKTFEDVVYFVPDNTKSYNLISYMYSKINNIPPEKFYVDGYRQSAEIENGKIIVVLDDYAATGESLGGWSFRYKEFKNNHLDSNIILAPLVCTEQGKDYIKSKIYEVSRLLPPDYLLIEDEGSYKINENGFSRMRYPRYDEIFNVKELGMFEYLCKNKGTGHIASGVGFPYMIPDNSGDLSGYLLYKTLNRPEIESSNRVLDKLDRVILGNLTDKHSDISE